MFEDSCNCPPIPLASPVDIEPLLQDVVPRKSCCHRKGTLLSLHIGLVLVVLYCFLGKSSHSKFRGGAWPLTYEANAASALLLAKTKKNVPVSSSSSSSSGSEEEANASKKIEKKTAAKVAADEAKKKTETKETDEEGRKETKKTEPAVSEIDNEVDCTNAAADYGGVAEGKMRSPILCVMGHVDTGKTKILDKIRRSSVQDGEAGGITQQIGASFIPIKEVQKQTSGLDAASKFEFQIPGLLIMDTPGHESFSNMRNRGSSMCNIAILVVDIMHGLEPQTRESIQLLRSKKCPFVIALNKVDRLTDWQQLPGKPIQKTLKKQKSQTTNQFDKLTKKAMLELSEEGLNCELYYQLSLKESRSYINIIPCSAHTGEGIPDLLFMVCRLSQAMLAKQITFTKELQCTVLEVKKIAGHGATIDVILADGELHEGDRIILAGLDGPIDTTIRQLLMPEPLKEMRVKNAYRSFKTVPAANGVKIAAKELEKALAGLKVSVVPDDADDEDVEDLKEMVTKDLDEEIKKLGMNTVESGVYVVASTLGSLEALLSFLKDMKIPVAGLSVGVVSKKDVVRCSIQLEKEKEHAIILAFDVSIDSEAKKEAESLGIKIFTADIIYHLFDAFTKHIQDEKEKMQAEMASVAVFPCKLKILPAHIYNRQDPIVMGVQVVEGKLKTGCPLTVPSKQLLDIGRVVSIQKEDKKGKMQPIELAKKGDEICIKIEPGGRKVEVGEHFAAEDELVSRISRKSIDACKKYFKDQLQKDDWLLTIELKKVFNIGGPDRWAQ
eukprot:gnl/MRDRNA2_/MRDRNA2_165393_c0_seq1.p1 gnl/MRDRNA2_/MRDRNA2_165393_c0~~gnl/MRDRNA2_/MRDRNA2_165393_c0_seq1.p1  ORF type:complete len:798 (+),score=178.17 gnl/MRDRNA2_/MRDRNA2_165393_c0_seq1:54-2396(+)